MTSRPHGNPYSGRAPAPDAPHTLAPYAARSADTRGRAHAEAGPRLRSEYQRDRDRVVHSSAFRRLEYKTQVFVNHEGDMYRTRLTHSLEVAQVSRTVAHALRLNEDLVEAIALAHDLGHTPFGHAGQSALNACMRDHGGFEHNLQSLRVVDVLEEKYAAFNGLNLCFETREGILKHCSRPNAERLGDVGHRFLDGHQPGLEAQLTNVCDELAYNHHDLDDGVRAGLLDVGALRDVASFRVAHDAVLQDWPQIGDKQQLHETLRRMMGRQIEDLVVNTGAAIEAASPPDIDAVRRAPGPLVGFGPSMREAHLELKRYLRANLYQHPQVSARADEGAATVTRLFEAYMGDARLLPGDVRTSLAEAATDDASARVVADYVAGMTDRFAAAELARLTGA